MAVFGGNVGNVNIAVGVSGINSAIEQFGALAAAMSKLGAGASITERSLAAVAAKAQAAQEQALLPMAEAAEKAFQELEKLDAAAQKIADQKALAANAASFGVQPTTALDEQLQRQTVELSAMRDEASLVNEALKFGVGPTSPLEQQLRTQTQQLTAMRNQATLVQEALKFGVGPTSPFEQQLRTQTQQLTAMRNEARLVQEALKFGVGPTSPLEQQLRTQTQQLTTMRNEARLANEALKFGVGPTSQFESQLRAQTLGLRAMRDEADKANERTGILGKTVGTFQDIFSGGSSAIAGASVSLGSFGVLAGAVATGSGFLLAQALAQIGKAAVEMAVNIVLGADRLNVMETRINSIFGSASDGINKFALSTGLALGLTQQQVLQTVSNLGNAFQEFGAIDQKVTAQITEGLTQAAAELALVQGLDVTTTLKNIDLAIEGNVRSLRELNIRTDQAALSQSLLAVGVNAGTGAMSDQLKQLAVTIEILEAARERAGAFAGQQKSLGQELNVAKAALQDFANILGQAILPAIKPFAEGIASLAFLLEKSVGALQRAGAAALEFTKKVPGLTIALKAAAEAMGTFATFGLLPIVQGLNALANHFGKGKVETDKFTSAINDATKAARDLVDAQGLTIQQAEAGQTALKAVADAQIGLERAKQDAITRTADVVLENSRKILDANIAVVRAEEDFTHTQVENGRKIADANTAIADAIDKSADDQKKAQERIDDENLQHTRKVEDLTLRIKQAKAQEAKSFLDAELAIENALLHGNEAAFNAAEIKLAEAKRAGGVTGSLASAERDLAREQEDHVRKLKRLNEDAAHSRTEDAKAVAKAELARDRAAQDAAFALLKAQEKIDDAIRKQTDAYIDAQRALDKLEVQNSRAAFDANKAVTDAAANVKKLADEVGKTVEQFKALLNAAIQANEIMIILAENADVNAVLGLTDFLPPLPTLAAGGPLEAGQPAIVGERGPELFIAKERGVVVSHEKVMQAVYDLKIGLTPSIPTRSDNLLRLQNQAPSNAMSWVLSELTKQEFTRLEHQRRAHTEKFISDKVAEKIQDLGTHLITKNLKEIVSETEKIREIFHVEGRQFGGSIQTGLPVFVGEGGPEVVIPRLDGKVFSQQAPPGEIADLLKKLMSWMAQERPITVVDNTGNPEAVALALSHRLVRGVT